MVSRRTYVILLLSLFATSIFAGKKLSDRELLLQTSWCLESTSHDAPVIQTLHQASRRYHIPELATYAHIRQKLVIDTCNRHALACHKSLIAYSDSIYGKVSYESVYLRLYSLSSIMLPEPWKERVEEAYTLAQELYKIKPTDENKELLLFSRYCHFKDNNLTRRPDKLREILLLLREAEEIYHRIPRSDLKNFLYKDAGSYVLWMQSLYSDYLSAVGNEFINDTIVTALFNNCQDSIYTNDSLPIYIASNYLWKESSQCLRELHRDSPMDVLAEELSYLSANTTFEGQEERIFQFMEQGYNQLKDYHGLNHPTTAFAHSYLRSIASNLNRPIPWSHQEDSTIRAYLLPDGVQEYIRYKYMELSLQIDNTLQLRRICRELRTLADQFLQDNPADRLFAYSGEWYLQRKAWGYDNAFTNLVSDYERECQHTVNWDMVDLGKNLEQTAEMVYSNIDAALKIEFEVVKMIQTLASDTSLLFKSEYLTYLCLAIQAYPTPPKNLDGTWGMDKLFSSVEEAIKHTVLYDFYHMILGQYYANKGIFDKAKEHFQLFLERIHQIQAERGEWYCREYEMGVYSQLAGIYSSEGPEKGDTVQAVITQLDTLYHKYAEPAYIPSAKTLVEYYTLAQEWEKAEEIVDFALGQYENSPQALWDGSYPMLMKMKVQILMSKAADIDQCRVITERLERDIERIKDIGNYAIYNNVLQLLCMLTGSISPNDIVHYKNLRLYYDNSREYYENSNLSVQIWMSYVLPAYLVVCQTILGNYLRPQHPAEYYLLRWDITHTVLPETIAMESEFKKTYPDTYELSNNYWDMVVTMITAYDIAFESDKAEEYLELLRNKQPKLAKMYYMLHYAYHSDYERLINSIKEFFGDDVDENLFGATAKRYIFLGKYMSAVQDSDWDKAEQIAWQYYDATQAFLQQNMPYFTQAEVEDFVMQQGVGGWPLQCITDNPKIKNKQSLIEKSYDINLEQKGLMLRKADQMRRVIESSGNAEWKAIFDTIQRLQREITETEVSQLMVNQNDDEIAKREHLFALERRLAREAKVFMDQTDDTITWQDVRNHMRKGEAAVEYVTVWDACYALVLTPKCKTPQYVRLENGLTELQIIQDILSDTTLNDIQKTEKLYGEDSELYRRLWKPIESALKGVETVYLSPTGLLNLIAFQALRVDEKTFLIDKYDIHQLTTTAALVEREQTSKSRSGKRKANVYGAIYYNELQELSPTRLAQLRREHSFNAPLLAKRLIEDAFPFLENTLYEADGISNALSSMGVLTSEKIGFAPNETEFRSLSGDSPDIIHIATHGFFIDNPDVAKNVPFFQKGGALTPMTCSGMVLANAENAWRGYIDIDSKKDNILTSAEVSELDLRNTDLVVLSACQTGVGTISPDGMFGLQRGFKQAGVHSICASLWSVADLSTSELMQTFYNYWMSGNMSMNQAMRKAMMEQRERTPAPYFWAPFILLDGID